MGGVEGTGAITIPFVITVAPRTFGQIEPSDDDGAPDDIGPLAPDDIGPMAPDDGPDVDPPEPVVIAIDPATGRVGARWTAPATAAPPRTNVAARDTVASADHHSRVPGLALFHRPPRLSIVPVIVPLLFCLPGGHWLEDRPAR
ncbi:MAG TPA: hypothetical protein VN791_05470 [Acidimicrobiales bacterium]|nr:hypothetical protein [Acidimicrobiales bacterium]